MQIIFNLSERIKSSSIGIKLFMFLTALSIVPIISLSFFLYFESTGIIRSQANSINELYLTQVSSYIAQELKHNANVSNLIAQNSNVKKTLELEPSSLSFSEEFDVMDELIGLIENTKVTQNIDELRIFINDSFLYSRSNPLLYELSSISNNDWFLRLKKYHLNQVILPPYHFRYSFTKEAHIISVATVIRSQINFDEIIGVVMADISVAKLDELIQATAFTDKSSLMILDDSGNIVLNPTHDSSAFDNIVLNLGIQSDYKASVYSDEQYLVGLSAEIFAGWRALSITPLEVFNQPNIDLRNRAILIVLAIAFLEILFVSRFSNYYQRRISSLSDQMLRVEKGDLKVRTTVDSGDEIGMLQNSFNFMIGRIESLVSETYELGQELKSQELRVLQEQINPHFLYNTLDLIYWSALEKSNDNIADTVLKLAKFYRLSLHSGKEVVSLKDEIMQSELFVDLLNQRSDKKIYLNTDFSNDINHVKILKLTLQPLIENAIIHGLFPSHQNHGYIICSAEKKNEMLHLSISDNGVGMSTSQLINLRHVLESTTVAMDEPGFGLLNTIKRLRMYFGDTFRYEIHSKQHEGTCIIFTFPLISEHS